MIINWRPQAGRRYAQQAYSARTVFGCFDASVGTGGAAPPVAEFVPTFWGKNPAKSRKQLQEEETQRVYEERVALGILPKKVQKIVQKVAARPAVTYDEEAKVEQLITALNRARIAYDEVYARVLIQQMRDQEEEEAILLLM